MQQKRKLWSKVGREELEQLPLLPYAAERRKRLLETLDSLEAEIAELDLKASGKEEARQRAEAVRLMTHPGVGPVTALAMVLTLGPAERFASGKQVGSYFGLIPSEASSGGKQRLGRISKQGSSFLRFFAGGSGTDGGALRSATEALLPTPGGAQESQRRQGGGGPESWPHGWYLMLREQWTYPQLCQAVMQVSPSHSVAGE